MNVQVVRAETRHQLMMEARKVLGPDPLILSVRKKAKKNGAGFEWEAVVAVDPGEAEREQAPAGSPRQAVERLEELRRELDRVKDGSPRGDGSAELLRLAQRLAHLEEELVGQVFTARSLPRAWQPLAQRLEGAGFPHADVLRLLDEVGRRVSPEEHGDAERVQRALREALGRSVAVASAAERLRPGLVVFVGGYGVGKTSLAAKLAADLCLGGGERPVLGVLRPKSEMGVETLRRCAEALDVEFCALQSADELREACALGEGAPLILDSGSVNPTDPAQLRDLQRVLGATPHAEIHAVVPASHAFTDMDQALQAFGLVGATRLSITRLDEAPYVGRLLAASARSRLPIGYLSRGPRIPDDLVRPAAEALVSAALRSEAAVSL